MALVHSVARNLLLLGTGTACLLALPVAGAAQEPPAPALAIAAGHFKEDTAYTPQDIRFTTKAGALYAITLGVPADEVRITSLGRDAKITDRTVQTVRLLGHSGKLIWSQEADALVIKLPAQLPTAHAAAGQIGFQLASISCG